VNDPDTYPVYETASGIGMPDHGDLLKHADPALIDEVAYSFPEFKIVLAHLGYPRMEETPYVARKHANVWCDISWPYGNARAPNGSSRTT
jgi:predicted TIM-barrel fold metal-dependent hydrolase